MVGPLKVAEARPEARAVTQTTEARHADTIAAKTVRSFRRWLGRRLRFKFRGGMVRDWQDRFSSASVVVLDDLERFYSLQVWGAGR